MHLQMQDALAADGKKELWVQDSGLFQHCALQPSGSLP